MTRSRLILNRIKMTANGMANAAIIAPTMNFIMRDALARQADKGWPGADPGCVLIGWVGRGGGDEDGRVRRDRLMLLQAASDDH
jgi:hypothetical protein